MTAQVNMDLLDVYEYEDTVALTSPSMDEGSSPYGHGTDSPFTPSPALRKHFPWKPLVTPPQTHSAVHHSPMPVHHNSPHGVLFATSPSPTRPAPSPAAAGLWSDRLARSVSPPHSTQRAVEERVSARRRGDTTEYHRDASLSPLAPQMASDTSDSDTVVSFTTTDEEEEGQSHQLPPPQTHATVNAAASPSNAVAPAGLPPIAPVSTHPYEVSPSSRPRSFSPPPPFPGEQVARALQFAQGTQRVRSHSPERLPEASEAPTREWSPSPRPATSSHGVQSRSDSRSQRVPSSSTVTLSSLSQSEEPMVVGVVEYSESCSPASVTSSPTRSVEPAGGPPVSFFSLSPFQKRSVSPDARAPPRLPLCRATVEIAPGHAVMTELFEGDDPEVCARAFLKRHALREEIALRPLTQFFTTQLQATAPPSRPVETSSMATVPQLRYKTPRGIVAPTASSSQARGDLPRRSGPRFSVSPDRWARGPTVTNVVESARGARRSRSISLGRTNSSTPSVSVSDLGPYENPDQLPPWNTSTRHTSPSPRRTGVVAPSKGDGLQRRPSTLSRSSSRPATRTRSRSAEAVLRQREATSLATLSPRQTRASVLRAEATRKTQEARAATPSAAEDAWASSVAASQGTRARSRRGSTALHQPFTAPGTERLCRERSVSMLSGSTRSFQRSTSSVSQSTVESSASAVVTPHYARTTQSARGRRRSSTKTPSPPAAQNRENSAPPPLSRTRATRSVSESKVATKRVSFADEAAARKPSTSLPRKASQAPAVRPVLHRPDQPSAPHPATPPRRVTSDAATVGRRSLFAHVDPNRLATAAPLSRKTAKEISPSNTRPVVFTRRGVDTETAAVAAKARLWFDSLGVLRTSPGREQKLAGATEAEMLATARQPSPSAPVDVSAGLRTRAAPNFSAGHSQLWREMGLDALVPPRAASALRNYDTSDSRRSVFQPYVGR